MVPTDHKTLIVIPPQALVDNTSWSATEIDRIGYDYAQVTVIIGALDIALTVLKIQETDATGTSYTDVTGLVFATSINSAGDTSTLPAADDDNKIFKFNIDLRGRKRFLDLVATIDDGSTGGYLTAIVDLYRAETGPNTAAEYGASQVLQVPAFAA
jgi:hypothetical protein